MQNELHTIKEKPECKRCQPYIHYLKKQYNEIKAKYVNMKYEREEFINKIKVLKIENQSLEFLVMDLRQVARRSQPEPTEQSFQEPTSPQFSEDSLPELERVRPRPSKNNRPKYGSFRN